MLEQHQRQPILPAGVAVGVLDAVGGTDSLVRSPEYSFAMATCHFSWWGRSRSGEFPAVLRKASRQRHRVWVAPWPVASDRVENGRGVFRNPASPRRTGGRARTTTPNRRERVHALSGHGRVSSTVVSCGPPLSAYRIRIPPIVPKRTRGVIVVGMQRILQIPAVLHTSGHPGQLPGRDLLSAIADAGCDRGLRRPRQHKRSQDHEHDPLTTPAGGPLRGARRAGSLGSRRHRCPGPG